MSQRYKATGRNSFERLLREPGNDLPEARLLPLDLINFNDQQFRQTKNPDTIIELANSIAEQGLLEPLIVRAYEGGYQVVAGARRLSALQHLRTINHSKALTEVPVLLRELNDQEAALAMAAENLQREDLTIADEAVMYERLISALDLNPERANSELGRRLGIGANRVQRARRLATYPAIMQAVVNGTITLRDGLAQASLRAEVSALEAQQEISHHGDEVSTEPESSRLVAAPFTTQHVTAHERKVPGKAWEPFYRADDSWSKFLSNGPVRLIRAQPEEEATEIKKRLLQWREQLDSILNALERDSTP